MGILFAALMLVAWGVALGAEGVLRGLAGRGRPWAGRLHALLHPFTAAFQGYRHRPAVLGRCLVVGAAGWGVNLCALVVFARAVGVDAGWSIFAVAIPVTLLATLAPFSVNGVGLREGVLVGLFTHAVVDAGHVGALSLLIDVQMLPFALCGAVVWLRIRRAAAGGT